MFVSRVNCCGNVSFSAGTIDSSLYRYVKILKKGEQDYVRKTIKDKPQEVYQEIEQRTNDVLEKLEQKAKSMRAGTHIAVQHNSSDDSDYLVVYSDKVKDKKTQIPVSKRLQSFQNTSSAWKLNNLGLGQKMNLDLNGWTYKEPLEILEKRVSDIDAVQTDQKLMKISERLNNSNPFKG